jgi:hypothetical protein
MTSAQMTPYTPNIYARGGFGRFRQYPRVVQTPIPGAGYKVGKMMWAEQELNLNGSAKSQPYGSYYRVPLRGLGDEAPTARQVANILDVTAQIIRDPEGTLRQQGPQIVSAADRYLLEPIIARAARQTAPYLVKYVMPPLAVLYVLSGLSAYYSYKVYAGSKRSTPNRRQRRSSR